MGLEERNGRLYYYRKETGDFGDIEGVRIDADALLLAFEPKVSKVSCLLSLEANTQARDTVLERLVRTGLDTAI